MGTVYEDIFKKNGFSKTQQKIIQIVGFKKTVLEVGASSGYMTQAFLSNDCIVDCVETDTKAANKIPKKVRKVLNISIEDNSIIKSLSKDYDFVILADVLEHLVDPARALKNIYGISSNNTKLIISMPNIASWVARKQLFFKGDFEYQESGLLDKTHLHFYTIKTLPKFLLENKWKTQELIGTILRLPFEETIRGIPLIGWFFMKFLYKNLAEKYKNLTYYHFLIVASK